MGGQYELLPPPSKRRRVSKEHSAPIAPHHEVNARLRAILRVEEDVLRKKITETKDQAGKKAQEDVEIGDAVQIKFNGTWRRGQVDLVNGTDIACKWFNYTWMSKVLWRFDEHAMLKFIQANRGDELAIFPSYQVFCNLFRECVDKWGSPTKKLARTYHDQTKLVSDYVAGELNATPRAVQFNKSAATKVLDRVVDSSNQEIDTLLRTESRPYTQDQRLFNELDRQRLRDLQEQVKSVVKADSSDRVALQDVMNAVASGFSNTSDREVIEMQTALQAYLDVAVPRFVDAIAMRLNDLILSKFVAEMALELNSLTDDRLARFMQDSEQKMTERLELKEELACLASAKEEIELVC